MLAPLAAVSRPLADSNDWPKAETLTGLLRAAGVSNAAGNLLTVRPSPPRGLPGRDYVAAIEENAWLYTRQGDWHDLFNALSWALFPRAKAALNHRLHQELRPTLRTAPGRRSPGADALTLFDESGVVVACDDPAVIRRLRARQWKTLFWEEREALVDRARFHVFGHALMQKALAPYIGLTGKCWLVTTDPGLSETTPAERDGHLVLDKRLTLDKHLAWRIAGHAALRPADLPPLPVLGVPGWDTRNTQAAFYDDTAHFRPAASA